MWFSVTQSIWTIPMILKSWFKKVYFKVLGMETYLKLVPWLPRRYAVCLAPFIGPGLTGLCTNVCGWIVDISFLLSHTVHNHKHHPITPCSRYGDLCWSYVCFFSSLFHDWGDIQEHTLWKDRECNVIGGR